VPRRRNAAAESVSPDKTRVAFGRDYNIWVRDAHSGVERQLTTDGAKDFGYVADGASAEEPRGPIVLWAPDSRRLATIKVDRRGVREMYLVKTQVGHPELRAWKY
jgi:hypothetical protein